MAFVDNEKIKTVCAPKAKNPLIRCRCAEMQKALSDVGFSYTGAQCMRVVIDEICNFCIKENGR